MFFLSQLIAILDWTNIGVVIASNLISFMSGLQFSGVLLIITMFVVIVMISIFIPDTMTKWELSSPVLIPLFMRSNLNPSFTQFLFKIADGIGKAVSPIFTYFIIMIAFLSKYNTDDTKQISILEIFKLMLPTILIVALFWIIFISLWYLIGFPIGPGTYVTL
jgi:aminobenzoyl-glutamate transport protein